MFYIFSEAGSNQIRALYDEVALGVYDGVEWLTDTNGTTLAEIFPNTVEGLSAKLMSNVFGNINLELGFDIAGNLYFELVTQNISMAFQNDGYFELYAEHTAKWVESGIYKQTVVEAFKESGEHLMYNNSTQTLEDFIDEIYDEFHFEEVFDLAFPHLYIPTYDILIEQGYDVLQSTDIVRMTTDYMRYLAWCF